MRSLLRAAYLAGSLAIICPAHANAAVDCEKYPVSMPVAGWCSFLDRFPFVSQTDPKRQVSELVKTSMGLPAADTSSVRSYAFVISIWDYHFPGRNDSEVAGIQAELNSIKKFLSDQEFDEAIILQNNDATADTIRKIFTEYYMAQFSTAPVGQKIRFMFIFDGHGWKPRTSESTGALALADISGDSDPVYEHRFSLAELRGLLQDLAPYTRSMVALLGSCYSGSVFPGNKAPVGDAAVRGPAAWIAVAAPRDTEAWVLPGQTGTVFYTNLIWKITHWIGESTPPTPGEPLSTVANLSDVTPRLSEIIAHINDAHEAQTKTAYPPFMVDTVSVEGLRNGAYRFIVPARTIPPVITDLLHETAHSVVYTGSSIVGRPDITVVHTPESYAVRGIDLSHWSISDDIDLTAAKAFAHLDYVYLKATQGSAGLDPGFAATLEKARAAGLDVGVYHTFDFCQPVAAQFANIKAHVPSDKVTLPLAIDVEWYNGKPALGLPQCDVTIAEIRDALKELAGDLHRYYGKMPLYYASAQSVADITGGSSDIPLWIANYGKSVQLRGQPGPWTFWQFSNEARIPGIAKPVDLNVFFGTRDQFAVYMKTGANLAAAAAN